MSEHVEHTLRPVVEVQTGPPTVRTRRVVAELPLVAGAAILLGGDGRFQGPALANARALLPWWAWGILWLLAGLGMCWGAYSRRTRNVWAPSLLAFMLLLFWLILLGGSVFTTAPTPPGHVPSSSDPPAPSFIGFALFAWAAHVLMEIVLASPAPALVGRLARRVTPRRLR